MLSIFPRTYLLHFKTHGELNRYPEALNIRVRATERISNVTGTYVTSSFAVSQISITYIKRIEPCWGQFAAKSS